VRVRVCGGVWGFFFFKFS